MVVWLKKIFIPLLFASLVSMSGCIGAFCVNGFFGPRESHGKCINGACIRMDGYGESECILNSDCVTTTAEPPTHLGCMDEKCVVIKGSGEDECYEDIECAAGKDPGDWEITPTCGDGYLSPGEQCDPGDHPQHGIAVTGKGKVYNCPQGVVCVDCRCVEKEVETHKACSRDYKCVIYEGVGESSCAKDEDCVMAACGNGVIDAPGEECDMGEDAPADTMTQGCPSQYQDCIECRCVDKKPDCTSSADCGEPYEEYVCYNNDVYIQKHTPYCANPATPKAQCKERTSGITRGGQLLPPHIDCDPRLCWKGECVGEIPTTTTTVQDITPTTTQPSMTCEDMGMYSTQNSCMSICQSPDYCEYNEYSQCWICVDVTVDCGANAYPDPDCNGMCDPGSGEVCVQTQSPYCYWCICPDLIVTAMHVNVQKSSSTSCQGEACQTDCSLTVDVDVKVRNIGLLDAGASTVWVGVSPGSMSDSAAVEPLADGAVSTTKYFTLTKFQSVPGKTCAGLSWWADTYTATATADYGGQVAECDEGNNQMSLADSE